ncbi:MAG: hypothetical protein ABJO36_11715 [Litorimonas sp.]
MDDEDIVYLDPFAVIPKLAKEKQAVMINESHFKPLHRVFVQELTKELIPEGYSHFGSELFGVDKTQWLNSTFRDRTYLVQGSSLAHYWSDPIFGQVAEYLGSANLTLFSYEEAMVNRIEGVNSAVEYREQGQAQNILDQVASNPNGKFIIFGGYHHVKETDDVTGIKWMAERFKSMSGLDPLTISQTECYLEEEISGNHLGYGLLANKNGVPISRDGYDLIIAAPKGEYLHERPTWLFEVMDRQLVKVPDSLHSDDYTLVVAINLDRPEDAPYEDIIYRHPNSKKQLALRPGPYLLRTYGKDYHILGEETVMID